MNEGRKFQNGKGSSEEPEVVQVSFVSYRVGKQLIESRLDDVEFQGIEEDLQGRDLVSFSVDGKIFKSYVFTRWVDA